LGLSLNFATVIPDKVYGTAVPVEPVPRSRVLDTISESAHHASCVIGLQRQCKTLDASGTAFPDLPPIWSALQNIGAKVLDAAALDWLKAHFAKVCKTMHCQLLAADGEADHIHVLVEYPPKVSVLALVNALKGTSSRLLRQERSDIAGAIATACCGRHLILQLQRAEQHSTWLSVTLNSNAPPPRPEVVPIL
jgi:REP element-mobilizing transposase RayT